TGGSASAANNVFNNITVNGSFTMNTDVTVRGTITEVNGTAKSLTLGNNANLYISGAGTAITYTGAGTTAVFSGGSNTTVILNGSGAQTLSSNALSGTSVLCNLTIASGNTVTISQPANLTGVLNITGGNVSIGAVTIGIAGAGTAISNSGA